MTRYLFTASCLFLLAACRQEKTKTLAMMVNLVNDSSLIRQYEDYHKAPWPEIAAANKAADIREVQIFRLQNRLVMVLTVPENWNQKEAGKKYSSSSPRLVEWGKLMSKFQITPPEAPAGKTGWVEMKQVYQYRE